jgi:hypothetical protein
MAGRGKRDHPPEYRRKKRHFEDRFMAWAQAATAQILQLMPEMKELYNRLQPLQFAADLHNEALWPLNCCVLQMTCTKQSRRKDGCGRYPGYKLL